MTDPSFHKNCPPWKPARLPTDIHPRRHFFANFNRHCRARWQSFSLASHTPMRFFISPWQCIPVRQPRGDIATHEGRRRDGECGNELGEEREGRGGPGGRGRETFLITSRRYRLCLSPQLLAISCQIFPACHWMAFAFTTHPSPLSRSRCRRIYRITFDCHGLAIAIWFLHLYRFQLYLSFRIF